MKRSAPLKRSGFRRPGRPDPVERERTPVVLTPIPPDIAARVRPARIAQDAAPVPKVVPVRHEGYRRLVAALACAYCLRHGRSQAAHPNTGKGVATKTDDRLAFPLCADDPGLRGCHSLFDQGALLDKQARRDFETSEGALTRRRITTLGLWPADLPAWPGDAS